MSTNTPVLQKQQDIRTISLIGLAHGSSHFFHLLLPPLFPWLIAEFDYSYSQLGVMVSLFFIVSGIGQMLSGFLVDRVGARPVLFAALSSFVIAGLIASTAQNYAMLMAASFFAGLGNAPFHPVDFTILNKRVSPERIGHAFSMHGLSGNIGWALAPIFMTGITAATGSWRVACLCGAAMALLVLCTMVLNRQWLDDRAPDAIGNVAATQTSKTANNTPQAHPMAFLKMPSVWMCFAFFFWTTCAMSAIQNYASPVLNKVYGIDIKVTAMVVTGYMLFSSVGMLIGGFLVGRVQRLEKIIAWSMMSAVVLLALVGTGWLPGMGALVVAAMAGFGTGLAGPSRDMLIKRAAPEGATGRVYGTVYSGLDLGFSVAAPVFGWMLDRGMDLGIFNGAAIAMLLGVLSALVVGAGVNAKKMRAASAV